MKSISKKLVEVMKSCASVEKNGTNSFHKYKYVAANDVIELVNSALTAQGIFSAVENKLMDFREIKNSKGNTETFATVETRITLIDSDSGESVTIQAIGSGQDAGDKAIAKAQTMALKYCYLTSFAIRGADEAEGDTRTDENMNYAPQSSENWEPRRPPSNQSYTCESCGHTITEKVANYSRNKYGAMLCYDCQKQAD